MIPAKRQKHPQLGFWDDEISLHSHDDLQQWCYKNAQLVLTAALNYSPEWTTGDTYYYDKRGQGRRPKSFEGWRQLPAKPQLRINKVILEKTLIDSKFRYLGFADLAVQYQSARLSMTEGYACSLEVSGEEALIEVKTSMGTLGELLRQLRLYAEAQIGKIVVVSSDDKYAQVLREQGFAFYKYDPDPLKQY